MSGVDTHRTDGAAHGEIISDVADVNVVATAAFTEAFKTQNHLHNRARWLGISGDQSGTDWAFDTLTPFVAVSSSNTWGTAIKVLGTSDTPIIAGQTMYHPYLLSILSVDHNTVYKLRLIYDDVSSAAGISAGQFSEVSLLVDSTNPQLSANGPVKVPMPRLTAGTDMVWAQVWNATNSSEVDFLVGILGYLV